MLKHSRTHVPMPHDGAGSDWRCSCCNKMLGRRHGSVVLIQFARGHCYRAPRPMTAICRGCGTLNET